MTVSNLSLNMMIKADYHDANISISLIPSIVIDYFPLFDHKGPSRAHFWMRIDSLVQILPAAPLQDYADFFENSS